jgi:hypothetical protein
VSEIGLIDRIPLVLALGWIGFGIIFGGGHITVRDPFDSVMWLGRCSGPVLYRIFKLFRLCAFVVGVVALTSEPHRLAAIHLKTPNSFGDVRDPRLHVHVFVPNMTYDPVERSVRPGSSAMSCGTLPITRRRSWRGSRIG